MSVITQTVCNFCGAVRRETNHWFRLVAGDNSLTILKHADYNSTAPDACGELCVQKAVSLWLATGKLEAE